MRIKEFQDLIREIYHRKDRGRGVVGTGWWLVEEVGELFDAIKSGDKKKMEEEFADVFAWLCSLANLVEIDLENAVKKYSDKQKCPKCLSNPCICKEPDFFKK